MLLNANFVVQWLVEECGWILEKAWKIRKTRDATCDCGDETSVKESLA
jgi:hypothetical protein